MIFHFLEMRHHLLMLILYLRDVAATEPSAFMRRCTLSASDILFHCTQHQCISAVTSNTAAFTPVSDLSSHQRLETKGNH